jgi:hypothetical protein
MIKVGDIYLLENTKNTSYFEIVLTWGFETSKVKVVSWEDAYLKGTLTLSRHWFTGLESFRATKIGEL